ncbi:GyrI-like domain-containing protein [Lampropedia aestuarii]|uniref:GyrI-like domain-containing protein n=1 Tax=Lampropedia aestuarii TaxID=2562762 RepID=UPI0024694D64|nr:GyrI-like domain-containing protein [Lampropedia aestuarii]MDH5857619.1 GyrI-like domain-containing protein [Lampropedia aestuarii]
MSQVLEPEVKDVQPFWIAGIGVRTQNSDEFNPLTAKLPRLWGQFFTAGMGLHTPNRSQDPHVYGLYHGYASKENGLYSVLAGVAVQSAVPGMESVQVQAGRYVVFTAKGPMPQTIVQLWGQVWAYFQGPEAPQRSFGTDFEMYSGTDTVAIHIGIHSTP